MTQNIHARYLETEVLSADPVKLIDMLYRGALEAISAARRSLDRGEILDRSRQIVKAFEIVHELSRSLDHEKGGEIAGKLSDLYIYMQARLMDANMQQSAAPLVEVETLLAVLLEAWRTVSPLQPAPRPVTALTEEADYTPVSRTL
jgi:flagellar secretion chaperone FliS